MKIKIAIILLAGLSFFSVQAPPSAFNYEGKLTDNGIAPSGIYEFQFVLRDAAVAGNQVGSATTNSSTAVSNGLFAAMVDFGASSFNGSARWLEIGVRTNGST